MYLRHSRSSFPRWLWFYWNKSPSIAGSATTTSCATAGTRLRRVRQARPPPHRRGVQGDCMRRQKRPVERNKVMTLPHQRGSEDLCVRNRTSLRSLAVLWHGLAAPRSQFLRKRFAVLQEG